MLNINDRVQWLDYSVRQPGPNDLGGPVIESATRHEGNLFSLGNGPYGVQLDDGSKVWLPVSKRLTKIG